MRQRVATIPGVQFVGISTEGFVDPSAQPSQSVSFRSEHTFEVSRRGTAVPVQIKQLYVSPDYFATLGMPITRGRAIGAEEDHAGSNMIVVNQSAAELLWPGEDPI